MSRTGWAHVLSCMLAAGCAPALVPCEPRTIQLQIAGSPRLNPDERGRPLPTTLVLYQLKDAARLESASFSDLWKDSKNVLQEDLVASEEITLSPSEKMVRTLLQKPGVSHVAVVALVRRPDGLGWRVVRTLAPSPGEVCTEKQPALSPLGLSLLVEEYAIRVTEAQAKSAP